MEEIGNKQIEEFYNACTDMTNAKLILADAKIGKILKTIMSCSELISAVGETLVNFNFDVEFSKAQVKNELKQLHFQLPTDKNKLIALVFNVLSGIDTHQLDLHSFIRDFFVNEIGDMSYGFSNFVYSVIFPFRDALCSVVGIDIEEEKQDEKTDDLKEDEYNEDECDDEECECEEHQPESQNGILNEFFDDITTILTQIKESVNLDAKVKQDQKDDINITIDALFECIELCNLKIMNALLISLNNLLLNVKSVRFYSKELQERLVRFYDELEE
mgnify:CR=1 FL=1